jgi:hypothetical protein
MINAVLRIFLDVVEQALRQLSDCDYITARFGAISTLHRHRYHGAFAPNSLRRPHVTALVKDSDGVSDTSPMVPATKDEHAETRRSQPVYLWAMLIARIYYEYNFDQSISW